MVPSLSIDEWTQIVIICGDWIDVSNNESMTRRLKEVEKVNYHLRKNTTISVVGAAVTDEKGCIGENVFGGVG